MSPSTTSSGLRGLIATAIFGFLGLGLCVVAAADPSAESRTVKFADLLAYISARLARMRSTGASERQPKVVCSYYFFATDTDKARCVRDATADAVTKKPPTSPRCLPCTTRTTRHLRRVVLCHRLPRGCGFRGQLLSRFTQAGGVLCAPTCPPRRDNASGGGLQFQTNFSGSPPLFRVSAQPILNDSYGAGSPSLKGQERA